MMQRSSRAERYRAAWVAMILVFCASIGVWSARIGGFLEPDPQAAPRPISTSVPHIVTVYSDLETVSPSTLCAELSPPAGVVTVETAAGVVLSRLDCRAG
jgi:hypothetical protein